jgi:hypothetical protein
MLSLLVDALCAVFSGDSEATEAPKTERGTPEVKPLNAPPHGVVLIESCGKAQRYNGYWRIGLHMEDMAKLTKAAEPFIKPTPEQRYPRNFRMPQHEVMAVERVWLSLAEDKEGPWGPWFEVRATAMPHRNDFHKGRLYLDREGKEFSFGGSNHYLSRPVEWMLEQAEQRRVNGNIARMEREREELLRVKAKQLFGEDDA